MHILQCQKTTSTYNLILKSQCQEMQPSSCVFLENIWYLCSTILGGETENLSDLRTAALQPKVAVFAERQKLASSFLKRLVTTIHPALRNFSVLKGKIKSSSLINVSKNNITLPAESGTGKQVSKVCLFFFLHAFCYCK